MKKRRITRPKLIISTIVIVLALAGIATSILLLNHKAAAPVAKAIAKPSASKPAAPVAATPTAPFNKSLYSTTDASSLWVIVNKQHPLNPVDYVPPSLVTLYGHQVSSVMSGDLQTMVASAASAGVNLTLASSYRSYTYQVGLYNGYVATDGQANADTYSARPGYSEHQTGLAIDFGDKAGKCIVQDCYGSTPEGQWLAVNAWQYGFILRYTPADQAVTGYESEPWHYRYVGQALSREMHTENIPTLEQFFGVTGGAAYDTDTAAPTTSAPSQE